MTISRDSFDKLKNYSQVVFNENVPLLDSEVNEVQQIQNNAMMNTRTALLGTATVGDDLLVIQGPTPNTVTVKAGTLFHNGYQVTLYNDFVISFLSTPLVARDDIVFIEFVEVVRNETYDPNLVDPAIGFPTTQRIQMTYNCRVNEGAVAPNPTPGKNFVQLATLHRVGGNATITSAMIEDNRDESANTYVLRGAMATVTGPLQVTVDKAQIRVGAQDYFFENPITVAVPPNATSYIIAQGEAPIVVAAVPPAYTVVIARVVTNGTNVTSITDLRKFQPLIYHSQADAATVKLKPEEPSFDADEVTGGGPGISTYYAAIPVSKFKVVCFTNTNNTVTYASNVNRATTPAVAIAIMDIAAGNLGTFLESGPITNPLWNWVNDPNKPIFLGVNGDLTQNPPIASDTVIQLIGVPKSSTTIDFKPSFITIRN